MEQEILDRINKRLEALEVVHTRYSGPPGRKGDRGDVGLREETGAMEKTRRWWK